VLSYYHAGTDCSIFRSTELLASAFSNRSIDDEKIIALIPQSVTDPELRKVVVLNSRQQGVEKNIGQGSLDIKYTEELPSRYSNCKSVFYNIQGAAELGELYLKAAIIGWAMMTADKNQKWMKKVEQTGYLLKIDVILRSGLLVSRIITQRKQCALIHCETGTVGSSLVSSVAQIFIEPFYRTFDGFKALINKEWAYFGYDFLFFNGIMGNSMEESQNKPAFIFFLDCVY